MAFDVSHLGTVRVSGPQARDRLQATLTNDLGKIGPGRAQYTHLLDDADGSVLDDIIVWWIDDETFDVMPNASNTARVRGALGGADVTSERAIIAIQGPTARSQLSAVSPEAAAVGRFRVAPFSWGGHPCVAAGTGYTGEDGVECSVPGRRSPRRSGRRCSASACSRPGSGHGTPCASKPPCPCTATSWDRVSRPLQAGLGWVVAWSKAGGLPGSGRSGAGEGRRRHPPAGRPGHRGAPARPAAAPPSWPAGRRSAR